MVMVPVTDPKRIAAARKLFGVSDQELARRKAAGLRSLRKARTEGLIKN